MTTVQEIYDLYSPKVGRIRGRSLDEKINFLIKRYEKVKSDCEKAREDRTDRSDYRIWFGVMHSIVSDDLKKDSEKESILNVINNLEEILVRDVPMMENTGRIDACAQIVLELRKALEDSDV